LRFDLFIILLMWGSQSSCITGPLQVSNIEIDTPFMESEVIKLMKTLKNGKCSATDLISNVDAKIWGKAYL
jgi:hypothetical protein